MAKGKRLKVKDPLNPLVPLFPLNPYYKEFYSL